MSLEPFLNLTFFSFLPAHFPEEDPRHRTEEKGQEEAAVHQTIFQPSLRSLRAQRKSASRQGASQVKDPTSEEKNCLGSNQLDQKRKKKSADAFFRGTLVN